MPASALALRGRVDEALEWASLDVSGFIRAEHLQSMCDTVAPAGDWGRAREVLSVARAEAASAEMGILGFFADRLEGRMAAATGDLEAALNHLGRAAEGFRSLQAPWEEAWSRLLLAESLDEGGMPREAERHLSRALPIFERLGSVAEIEAARSLFGRISNEEIGGGRPKTPSADRL